VIQLVLLIVPYQLLVDVLRNLTAWMRNTSSTNLVVNVNSNILVNLSGTGVKEAENVKPITVVTKEVMLAYKCMINVYLNVEVTWNSIKL